MPDFIELDRTDFITVDTIGPKGKRVFHLQAGQGDTLATFIMEKEQAQALAQAIEELFEELDDYLIPVEEVDLDDYDMALREPLDPHFRIAQMGLGYDQALKMIVLVVQELVISEDAERVEPRVARLWGTPNQMRALSQQASIVVAQGRADPKQNGRMIYYWL